MEQLDPGQDAGPPIPDGKSFRYDKSTRSVNTMNSRRTLAGLPRSDSPILCHPLKKCSVGPSERCAVPGLTEQKMLGLTERNLRGPAEPQ